MEDVKEQLFIVNDSEKVKKVSILVLMEDVKELEKWKSQQIRQLEFQSLF